MSKNRLLEALKTKFNDKSDIEISQAAVKIENRERLSSQEFQKVYEKIWQAGPTIKYQNPDINIKELQSINNSQNP